MLDIKLGKISDSSYDFQIENGDLAIDDGLETSLISSLFSDRRADESQVFQPERRRGWIGDLVSTTPGYLFGSHIWLLEQSRLTQTTLNDIEDYAKKALQWMVDGGFAINISADASLTSRSNSPIILNIEITSPNGSTSKKAFNLWQRTLKNAN